MLTSIQKKFTNIFLRQLQLLQAEITTNTSSPFAGWQNDDRPVPVYESFGYRAIIVWLLVSIQAPGRARPMSARTPFKSDGVLVEQKIARSKNHRPMSDRWYLYSVTPKIIVRPPLAFKYYLKLEGARPMSKTFSCCRPIVTAAGRTPADTAIFWRNRRRPAAFSYLWPRL
jgi:hypothetical protein